MSDDPKTIGERLSSYERWQKYSTYFGGGLAGLVLVADFTSDSFDDWWWSRPLFITFIIIGAVLLGRGYIEYVSASHKLQTYKDDTQGVTGKSVVPTDDLYKYPTVAMVSCQLGLAVGSLAGVLLLIVAW